MLIARTPDHRFENLPGYPFAPHYIEVRQDGVALRMHYLDEGDPGGETIVLLHGEPSWSFLYRKVIPPLAAAGHRVIAPDLIGFGRSDKPTRVSDYSYARHVEWLRTALFDELRLTDITLFAQDWGGLLSLRLVADYPDRFKRVMIANTAFPTGDKNSNFVPGDAKRKLLAVWGSGAWLTYAKYSRRFPIGKVAQNIFTVSKLSDAVVAGYDAPFPSEAYKAGARAFPQLVPRRPDNVASEPNRTAWRKLGTFSKPFRTAWGEKDPTMRFVEIDKAFQRHIPGAQGQRHARIPNAGHFLQEDQGELVAKAILDFIRETPNA